MIFNHLKLKWIGLKLNCHLHGRLILLAVLVLSLLPMHCAKPEKQASEEEKRPKNPIVICRAKVKHRKWCEQGILEARKAIKVEVQNEPDTDTILFTFTLSLPHPGIKIAEEQSTIGCFSERFQLVNPTSLWTEDDTAQLANSKIQCYQRYNNCILTFTKIDYRRYTVLCGN